MIKLVITLSLSLVAINAFTQTGYFDVINGPEPALKKAYTLLSWAQTNKPDKVIAQLNDVSGLDSDHIREQVSSLSKRFPLREKDLPWTIRKETPNVIYFERSFTQRNSQNKVEVIFQVYIELVQKGEEYSIKKIIFRSGSEMVIHNEVIDRANSPSGKIPPPPPPPPMFLDKEN